MKRYGLILMILFILPAVILIPQRGKALYYYAAKEWTRCGTCHVNPTGGMLRTQVGIDYAKNHHSFQDSEESTNNPTFFLGDNLQFGSDMRFIYYYRDTTEVGNPLAHSQSTFFTDQGAIYLGAYLGSHLVLFYNNDFGFAGMGQNREMWGMIRKLPFNSYIKAGRFKIRYGIRLDDHIAFIKDRLGFGSRSQDNGLEVGFTPNVFFAYLAVTNGQDPAFPFDLNTYKAFTVTSGFIIRSFSLGGPTITTVPAFPTKKDKEPGDLVR